jgi:ERCC4-type nuclease
MESFALVDRSRPTVGEQILVIVDDREAADDMAFELRRKGHPVDVREMHDDEEVRSSRARPPYSIG